VLCIDLDLLVVKLFLKMVNFLTSNLCKMAVVKATYGYRGRFIHNHNVLIHMHNCDWLASDGYFVSAKIFMSAHI